MFDVEDGRSVINFWVEDKAFVYATVGQCFSFTASYTVLYYHLLYTNETNSGRFLKNRP